MAAGTAPPVAEPTASPRRRRRWLRRILAGLVVLVLLVALLVTLATAWAIRRPMPVTSGTLAVPGLEAEVVVQRDGWGVPTVTASTSHDLFFGQGYVHAQDRFWEMDFRRHVTAGRLSELFGDTTLETDEFVRTMGWRRVAEQELALLSADSRALLQAYADGVNAYVADRSPSDLSLEYSVLALTNRGYRVEPWTPVDSLAWLKAMSYDLSGNATAEIARTQVTAAVGPARAAQIFPPYPYERHRPILDQGAWTERDGQVVFDQDLNPPRVVPLQVTSTASISALASLSRQYATVGRLLGLSGEHAGAGSNNWVVSGDLTATGMPVLANDPHLAPSMPSIWTQMGLHCAPVTASCPYDVAGFTFSGFPGVVIGHNTQVAWGFTNLAPDTQDLFLERVQGNDVIVDEVARPMRTRAEVIQVAGADDVTITVRETSHGPLMSDVSDDYRQTGTEAVAAGETAPGGEGYGVSIQWTALIPGRTAEAVFALDRASGWDEFVAATELFETPSQNIVYADVDGNIGYATGGKFPVRKGFDGLTPAPGWDSSIRWDGFVPTAAVPRVQNPKDGFIVTANNQLTWPGLGYPFVVDNAYGARSQRITDLVEERTAGANRLSVDDMAAIQNDSFDESAAWAVPLALQVPLDGPAAESRRWWQDWGYEMSAEDSPAAPFYAAFWRNLVLGVFGDELSDDVVTLDSTDRWYEAMRDLPPDDPWWDDTSTPEVEDRAAMMQRALVAADAELRDRLGDESGRWFWQDLHTLTITNQTFGDSGIAPIEWLFNRGPYPTGGTGTAPDATDWNITEGYEIVWIPSMRMVVDLSDLDASTWVNLTGASGHAFGEHYADQAPLWASGQTTSFPFTPAAVAASTEDTLVLDPADG